MTVRGRFAPTPSGLLHIGNARTALLAWLQVRSAGGQFVLRIEDIDKPRSKPEFARQILDDLRWLGIDWDEGPDGGGPLGPYTQSEREPLYLDALFRLRMAGTVYPCYCSRADLAAIASAPHGLQAEGPSYPGTCRPLTATEREEKAARKRPAWRFALPPRDVTFEDAFHGTQTFAPGAGGDFILERADGVIGYQLAVVVDDAAMGVTHVLRGDDLLDSTPRQLYLFKALGLHAPAFAHIPLLLGPDGERLSKRNRSTALWGIREAGIAAEKLVGYLAYWSGLMDRPESISPAELVHRFRMDAIPRRPVTVSEDEIIRLLAP